MLLPCMSPFLWALKWHIWRYILVGAENFEPGLLMISLHAVSSMYEIIQILFFGLDNFNNEQFKNRGLWKYLKSFNEQNCNNDIRVAMLATVWLNCNYPLINCRVNPGATASISEPSFQKDTYLENTNKYFMKVAISKEKWNCSQEHLSNMLPFKVLASKCHTFKLVSSIKPKKNIVFSLAHSV